MEVHRQSYGEDGYVLPGENARRRCRRLSASMECVLDVVLALHGVGAVNYSMPHPLRHMLAITAMIAELLSGDVARRVARHRACHIWHLARRANTFYTGG